MEGFAIRVVLGLGDGAGGGNICKYEFLYYKNKNTLHPAVSEIEDSVETHLCTLCVILRSRVFLGKCVLIKDTGRRLPLELQIV